ncbi:hypothetical protein [Paraflavitalea speifideaquila]|uniref:hypothetical protein n=1 Tax=Paraflavitalea speifideaquila TaxID=3076558 RepID=UPI0028E33A23|nr:hypothetical protein [Paraflavitalea speifideiaquila]
MAIAALASGDFRVIVIKPQADTSYNLEAVITKANGSAVGVTWNTPGLSGDTLTALHGFVSKPDLWSPEFPNLYNLQVVLKDKQGKVIHVIEKKFGFRTAELRAGDGFYLNDKR